jgi:hypothetical protein
MSNLIAVTGDFSSGSTLMFTLFRKTQEYYSLYEPLHEQLLEYLIWPLKVDEHHFFVDDYFSEYKGMRDIPALFKPHWGNSELFLKPEDKADDLYRYLSYVTGSAFGRAEKVMFKENRLTFRLAWFRANFPHARVIHLFREKRSQWNSVVRRVQAHHGREDVGQNSTGFTGFNIATWCNDLTPQFPHLAAENFTNGFDRFSALWDLSYEENKRHSDISISYHELTHNFEATFERVKECIGGSFEVTPLKQWVIPKEQQTELVVEKPGLKRKSKDLVEKATRKYAKARLLAQTLIRS